MSEEAPGPSQVPELVDKPASLDRTSDPDVAAAVAAYERLQEKVDRQEEADMRLRPPLPQLQPLPPKSSSELAVPAAHNQVIVSPEEQKVVMGRYVTLTRGILDRVEARTETPKEGPVLGARLGEGKTLRVVTVGEGTPEFKRARPDAPPVVEIYGLGWILDPNVIPGAIPVDEPTGLYRSRHTSANRDRTMRETFLAEGGKVVVYITAGKMEGTTYIAMDRLGQRDANLDDTRRLKVLFDEVEQAHSGAPAAEIQPGYTPLIYAPPKAIDQA